MTVRRTAGEIGEGGSRNMADGESSSNTGVVAIVVIFLIVVIAAVFAWRGGLFGGGGGKTDVNVDVNVPSGTSK
jgi:hypothetical protein